MVARQTAWNRHSASEALRIWDGLGFGSPKTIVDVGARESEFCSWLVRRFPSAHLISFEPDKSVTPLGEVRREALCSENGYGRMVTKTFCPELNFGYGDVEVRRFDDLGIKVCQPAFLKVDAESSTSIVLSGFGDRLGEFNMVVAEVINGGNIAIYDVMRSQGFYGETVLDFGHINGRLLSYDVAFWKTV